MTVFLVFVLSRTVLPCRAEVVVFTPRDTEAAGDRWEEFAATLPPEAAEAVEGLDPADPVGTAETLREKTGIRRLTRRVLDALEAALASVLPGTTPLFCAIVLSAGARAALPSPALSEGFGRVTRFWCAAAVFRLAFRAVTLARTATETMTHVMELFIPVMEGACLLSGEVTGRQTAAAGTMLAVTLTGEAAAHVLLPLTGALCGLTAVSAGCGFFAGLAEGVRRAALRIWQILTIVVSFLFGTQSVVAKAADGLAMRTAKFALSAFIPVAGSALADAWGTVRAGAGFLRGAAGIGGMLALGALLLPVLVPLVVTGWILGLARMTADLFGLRETGALLGGAAGIVELVTAFVLYAAMLFFVALVMFVAFSRSS